VTLSLLSTGTQFRKVASTPNKFRCPHCGKSYARESWWRKHECEKKKRFDERHNMDFIRGLRLFTHWRKRNNWIPRGTDVNSDEFAKKFADHRMYNKFMELVRFTSQNWVISSLRYLDYLIDARVVDSKWTKEETLKAYREWSRRTDEPISQIRDTFKAIGYWCEANKVDRKEFFEKIKPGQALQMVTTNRLSPWVLFGFDRCVQQLLSRVNDDWLCSINEYLNNSHWINRLMSSETLRAAVQAECERLYDE
jgi:predicted RNA-binding Zn-ribbon protein involved in translation (DUF1610 family)